MTKNRASFLLKLTKHIIECQNLSHSRLPQEVIKRKLQTTVNSCVRTTVNLNAPIRVVFKTTAGDRFEVYGNEGDSLLDVVMSKNVPLELFGRKDCCGQLTCSKCHVIMCQEDYDKLPDEPGDEEFERLDFAVGLTDTSRLGCQVFLSKELDGLEVTVPVGSQDIT